MEGHQQLQVPLRLGLVGQLPLDLVCQLQLEAQLRRLHELLKLLRPLKPLQLLRRLWLLKVMVVALDDESFQECRVI